jgi:formate-dependent nitrite reductase membrane component NrfD
MEPLAITLSASLILTLAIILGEITLAPKSEDSKRAIHLLKKGSLSGWFWGIAIGIGALLPLILILWSAFKVGADHTLITLASILALVGLWTFEDLWVKAGQAVPLS